jgi:hypothetical protein
MQSIFFLTSSKKSSRARKICAGVCWFCESRRWCQTDGQG